MDCESPMGSHPCVSHRAPPSAEWILCRIIRREHGGHKQRVGNNSGVIPTIPGLLVVLAALRG